MAEVIDMNRRRDMYFCSWKGGPSRIDTGFGDHHNIRSEIPSKHAIKKWHLKYTYNSFKVMPSPDISLLVAGIKTSLTHFSGNAILNRDSSVISDFFGQLCCLRTPLVLWQFPSSLLGQMFGVTHCPMVWVSGALSWALSGAGPSSSSTLIPWWRSYAIYCEIPPTFRATSATASRSSVVLSRSGSWWAATTVTTKI